VTGTGPAPARTARRARVVRTGLASLALLALSAALLTGCSSARTDVGTVDESCYLALPTAADAVGHAHLTGVRKYSMGSLRTLAPRLASYLNDAHKVPRGQSICLAAYTGTFSSSQVKKPLGRPDGTIAVAVVTTPGNDLLGTLILRHVPLRFQHTHLFG
jgi:hypothetical protein